MRKLLTYICTVFLCSHFAPAFAAEAGSEAADRAFVDQVAVDQIARTVTLSGWAVSRAGKVGTPRLDVMAGKREIFTGYPQRQPRPDVVRQTGRSEWLNSGWTITVPLTDLTSSGRRSLLVTVQFGSEVPITSRASAPENAWIDIPAEPVRLRIRIALILAMTVLLIGFLFSTSVSRIAARILRTPVPEQVPPALALVLCFAVFVGLGVSGSSLDMTQEQLPIAGIKTTVFANEAQGIRSDEWFVLSNMAIGQVRHEPPFPVVNRNLGPDGQNMLVVGMTSVPVWRLSAIGRPATWGFFFLPLPQALAWHWWLPVFGCVLGMWACFCMLFPGHWRTCLVLAVCFVSSPYVVAWSYWPAYVSMFAAIACASFIQLLKESRRWLMPLLALLVGISASGFVLTLYPAWQIPLGYLFLFLFVAVLFRDRHLLRLTAWNVIWMTVGLVIAGIVVASWWLDARDAVAAMVATIYPGQRSAELGGGIDPWYFARGFTNFITLYADLGGVSNASEVSSFLYLTLPALVGAVLSSAHVGKGKPVFFAVVAFLAFAFSYQFLGFPVWFARLTLWGRTFATRVDLAVGVASLVLVGCALVRDRETGSDEQSFGRSHRAIAISAAMLWTVVIWGSLRVVPEPISKLLHRPELVGVLLAVAWCSWLLIANWPKTFLASYTALLLYTTSAFNPWTLITQSTQERTAGAGITCPVAGGRSLVLGPNIPAMVLMASGCPILDGVSFYPQKALWRSLDPDGQQADTYNRYQRLLFEAADLQGAARPVITAPQTDTVKVVFDSRNYDFSKLPISTVLVEAHGVPNLSSNRSLKQVVSPLPGFEMFTVAR